MPVGMDKVATISRHAMDIHHRSIVLDVDEGMRGARSSQAASENLWRPSI
jgi:hypothetical protein